MNNVNCKRLEIEVWFGNNDQKAMKLFVNLFQSSFSHNLQECYIILESPTPQDISDVTLVLLHLIKLQHLKILHFIIIYWEHLKDEEDYIQIDKRILVLDIRIYFSGTCIPNLSSDIANTVNSVIKDNKKQINSNIFTQM